MFRRFRTVDSKVYSLMPKSYPTAMPDVTIAPISDPTIFENMGRLLRACADFETLLDIYIRRLCNIPKAEYDFLIGKTPVSAKISTAVSLAAIRGETDNIRGVFSTELEDIIDCRNTLAHGSYQGLVNGLWPIYGVSRHTTQDKVRKGGTSICYPADLVRQYADFLNEKIPIFAKAFRVESSPDKFEPPCLFPHPKSQPQRPQSKKPRNQPQSSGE